jgi:hypothetical protein
MVGVILRTPCHWPASSSVPLREESLLSTRPSTKRGGL